ncbi:MAG: NUDIX domain-containing protein [Clostridia bacterium]|nr:NUDIX domain-containing protein [Clostridia bacterium]
MDERFKTAVTVGLILLNDKGQILLQKRCNTGYMDGKYALVAGHLEKNESLVNGVIREGEEEINVILNKNNVEFVCIIRDGNNYDYINTYFKYQNYSNEVRNLEPEKCSELKWFDIDNLPDNIIPNDKRAINNMNKKIYLDEYNFN